MKNLKRLLLSCLFIITTTSFAQDIDLGRFEGCSEEEMRVLSGQLLLSEEIIAGLKDEVAGASEEYPGERGALRRVDNALDCIAKKLPKIQVKCDDLGDAHGVAFPVFGNKIAIHHEAISEYSYAGSNYTSSVLIHEVSHKCGMTDGTYFHHDPTPGPSNWGLISWTRIASTYQYWVMWGFCVPGKDCGEQG